MVKTLHPYELKIMEFMKTVAIQKMDITDLPLKPSSSDVEYFLRKMYEDDPHRSFTIRMSNMGKPLCQLQMEQAKAPRVDNDWHLPLRFMYGSIIEGLTVSVLKHAGIIIQEEQTPVTLSLAGIEIKGTLDVVIDDKVWDIKSASSYSFKEKFASYETLKEQDELGYLAQIYGYSKARGIAAGGWIVVDKSSGEVKIIAVPEQYQEDSERCLSKVENNVKILLGNKPFKRCFSDKEETFRKKFTGNRVLDYPCIYCPFKYSCWLTLKHAPSVMSAAFEKPFKYYSELINENTIT